MMGARSTNILAVVSLIAAVCLAILILAPVGVGNRDDTKRTYALSVMCMAAQGLQAYAADFDDRYPRVETWLENASKYAEGTESRLVIKGDPVNAAMNVMLDRSEVPKQEDRTVLLFLARTEAPGSWGGSSDLWQFGEKHHSMVCSVDGNSGAFTTNGMSKLVWLPREER